MSSTHATIAHTGFEHVARSGFQHGFGGFGNEKLTTMVPKEFVHRAAAAEVFLTGWKDTGEDRFSVTAQWPRAHAFYGPSYGLHDPLLLAETIRQTIPLLSHVAYGVPFGHRLIWQDLHYTLKPEALRTAAVPAELELRVSCHNVARRSGRLVGMRMEFLVLREGKFLASATARFTSHAPAVYRRLRGGYADLETALGGMIPMPQPVAPHLVGRDRRGDVVLAPGGAEGRWRLRTDVTHPVLFDHPVDHAPGMLLLEAARQAVQLTSGSVPVVPVAMKTAFTRYAEFDAPCWIETERMGADGLGRSRVRVTLRQNGEVLFETMVTTVCATQVN
ncbi:ScbA/BarX family gamma-butyrolactone biosynthesis protein [Streptomyces spiramyceticus]|uniref:ScbA/BarX family gamma-butyrolactone biosynthesis protein n=1 Tax=Streptomyces spiramyceticus TaxID=299717 RepID=UPI00237AC0A5|nr:ScbA/BarX family gamma-butyrolactone biosynthesis protein [Streptomyces spiramyceticus]